MKRMIKMPILNKENIEEVKKYKQFVDNYDSSSLMQSMSWADVKSGWKSEYVYIEEDGKIVMAMALLIRTFIAGKTLIYAPRGPVGNVYDIDKVKELMKEVDVVSKKHNAYVVRFDPEVEYDSELEKLYKKEGFFVRNKNLDKNELIQPRFNMILDIKGKTEEEIFKGYSEKTRYNIRVATRKGVTVRYSRDVEDLKTFYNLYEITGIRDKIASRPYSYFERMLNAFDENTCAAANSDPLPKLCKPRKIWSKFDKYAVLFHRAHDPGNGFARSEACGIFFPSAKQFLVAQAYLASLAASHNSPDIHPAGKTVFRM